MIVGIKSTETPDIPRLPRMMTRMGEALEYRTQAEEYSTGTIAAVKEGMLISGKRSQSVYT
jgi:hypothetical protein